MKIVITTTTSRIGSIYLGRVYDLKETVVAVAVAVSTSRRAAAFHNLIMLSVSRATQIQALTRT